MWSSIITICVLHRRPSFRGTMRFFSNVLACKKTSPVVPYGTILGCPRHFLSLIFPYVPFPRIWKCPQKRINILHLRTMWFDGKNRNTLPVRPWPLTRLLLMATCDTHPLPHLWCQNVARNVPLTRLRIHLPEPITPGLSWLNAKSGSCADRDRTGCAMRGMNSESRSLASDPSACY